MWTLLAFVLVNGETQIHEQQFQTREGCLLAVEVYKKDPDTENAVCMPPRGPAQ